MIFYENSDGRICIVFPYLGNVLGGRPISVSRCRGSAARRRKATTSWTSLRWSFRTSGSRPSDVVFSFSGIRPLPKSDHDFTGRISRGHFVQRLDGAVPQLCMVGGKWTTFRAFAEETADAALKELGRPRVASTSTCRSAAARTSRPIPSALTIALVERHGIDRSERAHLVDTYGTRAE